MSTVLYVLHRLLISASGGRLVLHCFDLVVVPLNWVLPPALQARNRIEVRCLEAADPASAEVGPSEQEVAKRFRSGNLCIAALFGQKLVGYVWVAREVFEETVVRCRFVPSPRDRVVWDFDLFVDRTHRGGLGFAALWQGMCSLLRGNGHRFTASRISMFNGASRRAHRRLGGRSVGKLAFLCFGRHQVMLATLSPYFHLSAAADKIPRIEVAPPAELISCSGRGAYG